MADLSQVTVPGKYPGTTLISEGDGPTGLFNNGPNPASLSFDFATQYGDPNKSIPLAVNQWLVLDGTRTVYAICATNLPTLISVLPGGVNFFNPSRAVASAVISATAPSNPKVGDLWFNSSNGNALEQWNGSTWVPFQWGTGSIAVSSITSALIAAGTIVAGIVNGTTITGATLIADGANGGVFVYSGVPATGNLIATITPQGGTDGNSNTYIAGITSYSATVAKQLVNLANGVISLADGSSLVNDAQIYSVSASTVLELDGPTTVSATVQAALQIQSGVSGVTNPVYIIGSKDTFSPGWMKTRSYGGGGTVEAWTSLTPGNGWSGTFEYKMGIENELKIYADLTSPASAVNGVTIVTLPSGYRPKNRTTKFNATHTGTTNFEEQFNISTAGALQSSGVGTSSNVIINEQIPLDIA